MCGPLAIAGASMALGIAQSAMSFVGQQQAYSQNREAANIQYANTWNAEQQKAGQVNQKQSEDKLSNVIDFAQHFGRIAASATTMGVGSGTLGAVQSSAGVESNRKAGIIDLNARNERGQIGTELQAANLRRTATINSVAKPNLLSLGLSIGGDVLGAGSTYRATGGTNLIGDISSGNFGV